MINKSQLPTMDISNCLFSSTPENTHGFSTSPLGLLPAEPTYLPLI